MTKFESRMTNQARNPNDKTNARRRGPWIRLIGYSSFGFDLSFGIRHSNFLLRDPSVLRSEQSGQGALASTGRQGLCAARDRNARNVALEPQNVADLTF